MTQVQFFVLLGTVLGGVLWQRMDAHQLSGRIDRVQNELQTAVVGLNGRIDRLQTEINGRIDRISDDLKQFYRSLGQHEARIDSLEKRGN